MYHTFVMSWFYGYEAEDKRWESNGGTLGLRKSFFFSPYFCRFFNICIGNIKSKIYLVLFNIYLYRYIEKQKCIAQLN